MNKVNAFARLKAATKRPTSNNFRVDIKDSKREEALNQDKGVHVKQQGAYWCIIGDTSKYCYEKLSSQDVANAMLPIVKSMLK